MKKILTIIILILLGHFSFAQHFILTPGGFVSLKDKSAYVVIDKPNTKQKDLYKSVFNALSAIYKDPKEVLSVVDGESITINGYEKQVITDKAKSINPLKGKITYKYDLDYSLSIQFKDGKIRINSPTFECKRWYENGYQQGWTSGWTSLPLVKTKEVKWAVFDENGKIISQEAFNDLNNYFNTLIKRIVEKSENMNDW